MEKGDVFFFEITRRVPEIESTKTDDVISGYSTGTDHTIKDISGKNGSRKLKLGNKSCLKKNTMSEI